MFPLLSPKLQQEKKAEEISKKEKKHWFLQPRLVLPL
jgi:hypothetical protein